MEIKLDSRFLKGYVLYEIAKGTKELSVQKQLLNYALKNNNLSIMESLSVNEDAHPEILHEIAKYKNGNCNNGEWCNILFHLASNEKTSADTLDVLSKCDYPLALARIATRTDAYDSTLESLKTYKSYPNVPWVAEETLEKKKAM